MAGAGADAEGVAIAFVEGDAEALPFGDGEFDAVTSLFGAMFAPDHAKAAEELLRVCRPGGTIALASWTPDGFIGEMLKVVAAYVPPAPGVASPLHWGLRGVSAEVPLRRGHRLARACTERTFTFRFISAEAFVDYFRRFYGPTFKAFEAVGNAGDDALYGGLVDLVHRYAGADHGPVAIPATWLESVAIRV